MYPRYVNLLGVFSGFPTFRRGPPEAFWGSLSALGGTPRVNIRDTGKQGLSSPKTRVHQESICLMKGIGQVRGYLYSFEALGIVSVRAAPGVETEAAETRATDACAG